MNILLVEDDPDQAQTIIESIKASIPGASVRTVGNESEFEDLFTSLHLNPPDLFIFDLMLPWCLPEAFDPNRMPPGHAKFAGLRCAKLALGSNKTKSVPMIINSVLSAAEVRSEIGVVPPNMALLEKGESLANLSLMIKSLISAGKSKHLNAAATDIFIVHGHDDEAKETVARFIEKLGGRAVILHEQPNAGRTIIEKFEHHANVAFAIVLLTPDDVGGKNAKALKQRARQNVVFELGFFFAKLGRNKVCALHKEDVEIPSDIQGVIYTPMDKAGAWRTALARELKAAGIPLDYTKVI
jgi:predicted nucleotide-binding protein/CheY-like chemotaxis protein